MREEPDQVTEEVPARVLDDPLTPAPPPMPTPKPAVAVPTSATLADAPPATGRWAAVDTEQLKAFARAVDLARMCLDQVKSKVDQMQGEAYTPKLGTSPVGQQLAKKFDDRLNKPFEPQTGEGGLRGRLADAMARMEAFVASAELARKSYEDTDDAAAEAFRRGAGSGPGPKHG